MTESGLTPAGPAPDDAAPDALQALTEDIERTREDIGETVAALAAKTDIKARMRTKAGEVAGRLSATISKVKEQIAAPQQRRAVLTVAVGAAVLAGVLVARRRQK
jgi:predicted  nucleic acid-binding Zn-ribbon protein